MQIYVVPFRFVVCFKVVNLKEVTEWETLHCLRKPPERSILYSGRRNAGARSAAMHMLKLVIAL